MCTVVGVCAVAGIGSALQSHKEEGRQELPDADVCQIWFEYDQSRCLGQCRYVPGRFSNSASMPKCSKYTGAHINLPGLPLLGVQPNRGLETAKVLSSEGSACAACRKWDFKPASGDGDLVVQPVLATSEYDRLVDVKEDASTAPDSCARRDCKG